jgi:GNAT superfamily N-acetyltransferase
VVADTVPTLKLMWVGEIDVHDDDLIRRFWETGKEADGFERPYAEFWSLPAMTVSFRSDHNSVEQHPIAALEGKDVLGTNQVMLPVLDNLHIAYMTPLVRPSARGRGIGTALLEAGLQLVRDSGRTTVIVEVNMPLDGASLAQDFLVRRGFETGIVELHRILTLPVAETRLADLAASASPHHVDYELVTVGGELPEQYLDGYCQLQEAFNSEAPSGDLDIEPESWDADRVRTTEARLREQGRRICSTLALSREGPVVALTEMLASDHQPRTGWQSGTLVVEEHRGHRLGLAVKVANLRSYQRRFPAVEIVHSWNAEENGPMVAINDTLGFRPVERLAEMQLKL